MLMGGMGPVNTLHSDAGKIFAGLYALYCGLVELVAIGIFAVPIMHRFLHHFHLESKKRLQPQISLLCLLFFFSQTFFSALTSCSKFGESIKCMFFRMRSKLQSHHLIFNSSSITESEKRIRMILAGLPATIA